MRRIKKIGPIQFYREENSWTLIRDNFEYKIIFAAHEKGGVFLWVESDEEKPCTSERSFAVVITGWDYKNANHLFTIKDNDYIWHVLEKG